MEVRRPVLTIATVLTKVAYERYWTYLAVETPLSLVCYLSNCEPSQQKVTVLTKVAYKIYYAFQKMRYLTICIVLALY